MLTSTTTFQNSPASSNRVSTAENCQFLTFDNPFCEQPTVDAATFERLHHLLKSGSVAMARVEIDALITAICRSCAHEKTAFALAELCLEINMLSSSSAEIGKRISVWFDSYSGRLNVKAGSGRIDSISVAHLID